ncbi:MAG: hypothetical protein ABII00_00860 [Elusimicrobiota bacterium]
MRPRRSPPLAGFLIGSVAFAAYVPTLSGGFLLDDRFYILANETLRHPALWFRFLYDPLSVLAYPELARQVYRPAIGLYFGMLRLAGGENPYWYHLAALLLHAANTILLFLLARRLLARATLPAAAAALLFALHPAQAESVAYVGNAPTLLATALALAALLAYGATPARRALSAASFAMALLCRESAAFLLPILPAFDRLFAPQDESWRGRLRRWAPYAGIFAAYLAARTAVLGRIAQRDPWEGDWATHAVLALRGLLQDLAIAFWPARLRVCYSFPETASLTAEALLASGILAAAAAAAALGLRRRSPAGFAGAWFLAALLPVSNIIPLDALAADRFLYAPLIGVGLLWGWALARLRPPAPAACLAALTLAAAAGLASLERQLAWRDGFILDLAAHATAPEDPCTGLNLSAHYYNWSMLDRAESLAIPALAGSSPLHLREAALARMAFIRIKAGRPAEAVPYLEKALAHAPRDTELQALLRWCSERRGASPRR